MTEEFWEKMEDFTQITLRKKFDKNLCKLKIGSYNKQCPICFE